MQPVHRAFFAFIVSGILGIRATQVVHIGAEGSAELRADVPAPVRGLMAAARNWNSHPVAWGKLENDVRSMPSVALGKLENGWTSMVGSNSTAVVTGYISGCPLTQAIGRRRAGLVLLFLSMCLSSLGFVMQRKAHLLAEQETFVRRGPHPLWLLGVAIYISAALPDVVAYTRIPQMLCCSVGCLRIVMMSLMGHFWLGDRLRVQEVAAILTCTFGAVLCIMYGPGNDAEPEYPGELHSHKVMGYVSLGLFALGALFVVVHTRPISPTSTKFESCALPMGTALAYGLEKVFNSELSYVPGQDRPLLKWLLGAIATFGVLDFYLNLRAAKRMPVSMFIPLNFAFGTLVQNFQGLVIFDEIKDMTWENASFTFFGAGLALAGALTIQPPQFGHLAEETKRAGVSGTTFKELL